MTSIPTAHPETLLFFMLLQLALIVLAGRAGGAWAYRMGQAAAVGEIIAGILLGPSFFGWIAPGPFQYLFRSGSPIPIDMLSQLGLILLMFQIGLEFQFGHLGESRNRRAVLWVAGLSLAVPFVLGAGFGVLSASSLAPAHARVVVVALFTGTAFAITALPILGRILIDFGLTRCRIGVIAISAAAINDVAGWLLLALVTALARAPLDVTHFVLQTGLVLGFLALWMVGVRPLMRLVVRHYQRDGTALPSTLLGLVLVMVFVSGMATERLGIFAIFGGFMMGVVLHDEQALVQAWREQISPFVLVFFLPIFFTYTGLRTDIGGLNTWSLWLWCGLVLVLAMAGKYLAAYAGARWAGLCPAEARIVGVLMNTRALMELIVVNVGYDLGALSRNLFTMLVLMSVVSTLITTPCLRRELPKLDTEAPEASADSCTVDDTRTM